VGKGGNTERDVNREVARRENKTKSTQRQEKNLGKASGRGLENRKG